MEERRGKFYSWGYEGDEVSPEEIAEFEQAWTRLLGVTDFEPVPFPTEDSIKLRPPHDRYRQVNPIKGKVELRTELQEPVDRAE